MPIDSLISTRDRAAVPRYPVKLREDGINGTVTISILVDTLGRVGRAGSVNTPKDFMKQKQPAKETERVACLGYFLVHHRSTDAFRSKELLELNTEARGPAFSNIAVHLDNAKKAGYLTSVGGGRKGITARGEALVEALPNREAVNSALAANPTRARRKGKKAKRTT